MPAKVHRCARKVTGVRNKWAVCTAAAKKKKPRPKPRPKPKGY